MQILTDTGPLLLGDAENLFFQHLPLFGRLAQFRIRALQFRRALLHPPLQLIVCTLQLLFRLVLFGRRKVQRRKQPESFQTRTNTGVITIQGLRQSFDIWKRRVGGLDGILKMDPEYQQDILVELQAFAMLHHDISRVLNRNQH